MQPVATKERQFKTAGTWVAVVILFSFHYSLHRYGIGDQLEHRLRLFTGGLIRKRREEVVPKHGVVKTREQIKLAINKRCKAGGCQSVYNRVENG